MSRLRQLFSRRRQFDELSREILEHIEEKTAELIAGGMSPTVAVAAARREFGNVTLVEQDSRGIWRWAAVEDFFIDVRYGFRVLRKSPGFSAVAVLTIALGIGANAAIYGLVDSALLSALPFQEPERLVHVWTTDAGGDLHSPLPNQYLALRKYSQVFEQVSAVGWVDSFYGNEESKWEKLSGLAVSANWSRTLGVQAFLGRNFLEEEQTAGRDRVVILSYGCWKTRFHADPRIIGKQIYINHQRVTVIGVLPRSLGAYYDEAEILAPLVVESYETNGGLRVEGAARVRIVARLKPGVTLEQARAETEAIADGLRPQVAQGDRSGHLVIEDFSKIFRHPGPTVENARHGLWMMIVAAGVVLLSACANVASLLLARGVKRQKEVAVRSALGCSRARLIRQLLTENALLFLFGGVLGLVAVRWCEDIITNAVSGIVSNHTYLQLNARVFAAGLGISFLSALVFGIVPALSSAQANVSDSLKDVAPVTTSGSRSRRPRNFLVGFQVALGTILLVVFGLLFRSLQHVERSPLGYEARNTLTATVSLPVPRQSNTNDRTRFMKAVIDRTRLLPGVELVGITNSLPMTGADSTQMRIQMPSNRPPVQEETWFVSVSPEYFATLKVGMLEGRPFKDADKLESPQVAIINRTFAEVYFHDTDPLGYHISLSDSPASSREIVGVVSDFRQRNPEEDVRPLVYFPVAQMPPLRHWSLVVRVRAAGDMSSVAADLAKSLQTIDPGLYCEIGSMQQLIHDSESLKLRRPILTILASFGALAVVVAIVGVFGVTSFSVAERTREIGIRVALGAARAEITGLLLREALGVLAIGLTAGAMGALTLSRLLPTGPIGWSGSGIYLYGISFTDPLTYLSTAAILIGVVLAASWIPAKRAMKIDPMVALRYE
jgi:putative ABC transport system permease protein